MASSAPYQASSHSSIAKNLCLVHEESCGLMARGHLTAPTAHNAAQAANRRKRVAVGKGTPADVLSTPDTQRSIVGVKSRIY
eukprot:CAMPEP_0203839812 /NCGR_PEP_ID=MMETSP0359-20131031/399_1 /ASSEMBLY_ACC=CAM_ASM_000338 /TAXON_ID=268821 /ORGANISM="Scrippsiella Hangoei, Strain SHTV-5" /LENGTH=81 /DNA_ID=CAMNT_0050753913 /DNA_START=67 /DNA_END=309 /DNA_ORIENTATION=+